MVQSNNKTRFRPRGWRRVIIIKSRFFFLSFSIRRRILFDAIRACTAAVTVSPVYPLSDVSKGLCTHVDKPFVCLLKTFHYSRPQTTCNCPLVTSISLVNRRIYYSQDFVFSLSLSLSMYLYINIYTYISVFFLFIFSLLLTSARECTINEALANDSNVYFFFSVRRLFLRL